MATTKPQAQQQEASLTLTPNLAAIAASNQGLQLTAKQVADINAGILVNVPQHASSGPLIPKGCITLLRFGENDKDLDVIEVDGVRYSGGNIREFKETLLKAACCHICINFCWHTRDRRMTMLNLYPCSECRPNERCGCGDN